VIYIDNIIRNGQFNFTKGKLNKLIQSIKHIAITEFYMIYIETLNKRIEDKVCDYDLEMCILDFIDINTNSDLYVKTKYILDDFKFYELYNKAYREITVMAKS
jgi:hypothetical protein